MIVIGVTGGVGSGKSEILSYMKKQYNCRILRSDDAALKMEMPGGSLYEPLVQLLSSSGTRSGGSASINPVRKDGSIDKKALAQRIFADPGLLEQIDALVHPAVKKYILDEIGRERRKNTHPYFLLEAALLIENGFTDIVDSMWYIYCDPKERRRRLKESRGYSDEKITRIMDSQLSEQEFRRYCDTVIDNSGDFSDTKAQIGKALAGTEKR